MADFGDRVKETTTTTGTGTVDLNGAPIGFFSFADEFLSGAQVTYLLVDDPDNPNAFEFGVGTFTAGTPNTLSRDTVEGSSASGTKITLAGTTTVIATPTKAHLASLTGNNSWTGQNSFNGPLAMGDGSELTIATGAVTPTANYHTVDTEADAPADDLTTINTTNVPDGGLLILRAAAAARVVTLLSGASPGNISLQGGGSFALNTAETSITLQRRGTVFVELTRSGSSVLVGSVVDYAANAAPPLWLLCDGAAVSRTTYAALFAVIGTTWGIGDGSTTFNIPDLRGRVVAGQDDMGGTSANRLTGQSGGVDGDIFAAAGGAETHALTEAEGPVHSHTITQGSVRGISSTVGAGQIGDSGLFADRVNLPSATNNAGSGTAHNNVQPTAIMNKIIFANV